MNVKTSQHVCHRRMNKTETTLYTEPGMMSWKRRVLDGESKKQKMQAIQHTGCRDQHIEREDKPIATDCL